MPYKHVLFPFDYSGRCRHAAPFVKNLIEKTGAELTMLNVIEDPSAHYPASAAFLVPPSERAERLACSVRFLQKYAHETFPGYAVDAVCRMGDPAKEIIWIAAETHVDLIMMPTRGYGQFRRLLLGSVTAKVLDDAKCPVWTDAHMDQEDREMGIAVRNILCAVDDKKESLWILRAASDLANFSSATLHLMHVIPEIHVSSKTLKAKWEHDLNESCRLQMIELRTEACANADIYIECGTVSHMVRKAALECKADLVVIGRGSLQGFLGRLRTNAYAIIRDSPCPVLSV